MFIEQNWVYDGNNTEQSFNKTQFFNNFLKDCSEGLNIFSTYRYVYKVSSYKVIFY